MKRWVEELAATEFPKGRHSQGGQDGVLRAIFEQIGTVNTPPLAVEFGFDSDSLAGGFGSNVANLVLHHGVSHLREHRRGVHAARGGD